jgi:ribonuclease P protein component
LPTDGPRPNLWRFVPRERVLPHRGRDRSVPTLPPLAVSCRGGWREAHLPTEQPSSCPQARLSQPDEHPGRPSCVEGPPRQGSPQAVGLIWRIRERDVFARLSHDGRRARAGVLWCSYLHDPSASPPRVAFAVGRAIGSSVVRNRVRRRLRAALSGTQPAGQLPPGWYLIGARPGIVALSFAQLTREVIDLVAAVERQLARPAAGSSDS